MTDWTEDETALMAERDAAIARAIAAEAREREIGEELDKATGMVEMHVGDAEAARLLWRSSEKACAHMDTQRAIARAERDDAEQMVAELRAALVTARDIVIEISRRHTRWVEGAYDTIEAAAHIAGRWCLASERDAALAENARLRHAAAEVLAWRLTDTTALLTNPPQNAALFHAQRLLREAMGD